MSGERRHPRTRDRMLGAQLRAVRTRFSGLTLEQAAEIVHMSPPTLSRVENGRRYITSDDAAALLIAYRAPRHVWTAIMDIARQGIQEGIWRTINDQDDISILEDAAHSLTEWSITTIPPLLQTTECTAAQLQATGMTDPEIGVHLDRWNRRRANLPRLDYTAFIHESALNHHPEHHDVRREQLIHLINAVDRGIGVRILRHRTPLHQISAHPWSLLQFPKDPPIVHLRLQAISLYLHEPESTQYGRLRARLRDLACSSQDSQRLLSELASRARASRR